MLNGCYDLTQSCTGYDQYEIEDKILTREVITATFSHYGLNQDQFKQPLFSPYFESDLSNLPKTTIIVGEYDGLRNDAEAYYQRVKAAGNQVKKVLLPGQTHNTIILREAMTDGEDPAEVIAKLVTIAI